MIICDQPALFAQCCQRTSHVISLEKSSIKSGQRRSGPSNPSRKARQNFFFPTKLEINHVLLLQEAKSSHLPYAQSYTPPLCTTGISIFQEQRMPGSHSHLPEGTAAPIFCPCPNPGGCHSEGTWGFWFWSKELLGGTTPLAENT